MQQSGQRIPLNCVDKCLLALDGIRERMVPHIFLHLEGDVDVERLRRSILSFLEAHPIMRSVLRTRPFRVYREVRNDLADNVLVVRDMTGRPDPEYDEFIDRWVNTPLDLANEYPFKMVLIKRAEARYTLIYTIHHMASDGLGMALFILRVVDAYTTGGAACVQEMERIRGFDEGDQLLGFARQQRPNTRHYCLNMVADLFNRFVTSSFKPPARIYHDRSGKGDEVGYCFADVPRDEFGAMKLRAKEAGVTVNDVLLAACYRTIEKWNRQHGRKANRIRIMAPVYIGPKGPKEVVANQVSWISLVTLPEERADQGRLLHAIRQKMATLFRDAIPYSLLYFFYFCSRFPLSVMRMMCRFLMVSRIYVDSILLSNVGVIWSEELGEFKMGDVRIADLTVLPPVVTPQGLSIVVYTYYGRLQVCLGYKAALFSREKAREFLAEFMDELNGYSIAPKR